MKRTVQILILFISILWIATATVQAAPLWESDTIETVTQGVQLRKLDRFYQNTWDKIRVLYMDLNNPNLSLRVLTAADGVSALETTMSMAERTGAVAAVNGDFFNVRAGQTNALGMVVQNGEYVASPSKDPGLAGFALTQDNEALFAYFTFEAQLISPQGYTCELYAVNKLPSMGGAITMLTSAWGKQTYAPAEATGLAQMVVEDGKVSAVYTGAQAIEIPQDGYVLVTNSEVNGFLTDNFEIGDAVGIEHTLSPQTEKLREATGGGTLLVQDGKVAPFTNTISGYSQRTAIGVDKKGETLMFVTVDGRLAECEGMNQTELARLLIELGCDTALNLDGGGSTTMVARDRYTGQLAVQNTLVGSMRMVSTAIGIFEDAPKVALAGIEAKVSASAVARGSAVSVEYALFDKYYNPVSTKNKVNIASNRPAKISGTQVVPLEGGDYVLTLTCGKAKTTVEFASVAEYTDLYLSSQSKQITVGESYNFDLWATDAYGHHVRLDNQTVNWTVDSDAFSVTDGKVRALSEGSANVCAQIGDLKAYAAVATPSSDLYNKPNDVGSAHPQYGAGNGYTLCISGDSYEEDTLLKRLLRMQREEDLKKDGHVAYRLGGYNGDTQAVRAVDGFTAQSINNNLLITVNNKNGGIKKTDASQWPKLIDAIENAKEHSIVLLMPKSVYTLEENEKRVFDAVLADAVKKGKNVYVVYEGSETEYAMTDGVTYIVCGALKNAHTKTFWTDAERFGYVKLILTLQGVKFEFVRD